ncbi:probable carbohydrate esterase At4g34215 [Lolium perenne]|uniref:probable carbohydrate esterase At4g34215 n=1 Tax=Lolium perenne TaxID=4522 RepID=UPI0021EAD1B1|nr:probable carbohydrate esterase At4g34215 [Lolium perenne]
MFPLQALLLCLAASATPRHASAADVPPSNKLIFILAGQSNMAGRGGVTGTHWDDIVPSPDCSPSPSVLRLSPSLRWEQAREPLHQGIDGNRTCGVGPGMAFANAVLRSSSSSVVIGLVPCAAGGTRIAEWAKGSELYTAMLRRARAAVETGGRIGAVLWYQGESDTVRLADANAYGQRVGSLVRDLRADLAMPDLLVIQVGLASGLGEYTQVVREAQKGFALPNVRFVDAMRLPLQDDHLHLTTQAQVQLGHMLAQSYLDHGATKPLGVLGHAHCRTLTTWWLQIMLACCFIFL